MRYSSFASGASAPLISVFSLRLMARHRVSADFHGPGISESTLSRARTSSPRFVSCVDVVDKAAADRIKPYAIRTPLVESWVLNAEMGARVFLKMETLQRTGSFKFRGACNRLAMIPQSERGNGVVAFSSGNHAQGVALAAKTRGIPALIVMPLTTPEIKVRAVADMGAEIVLHGDDYDGAYEHAVGLARDRALVFVHPFDDPDVIAGQGTIGVEILHQHPDRIEAIFVPVGGGGLAAGIASYVKFLRPETKVIGVEPVDAASMKAAI